MLKANGKKSVMYIGFCADEYKRFKYELNDRNENVRQIYPLAENGINELDIWEWAKTQEIFNDYYKWNKRCGCICCPMSSIDNLVYTKVYYPQEYKKYMSLALETEKALEEKLGRKFSVWASDPKYNTEYKMRRVEEIIRQREEDKRQMSWEDLWSE